MAALCPGHQYGLSSQESFGENKDLIFVKLTDSALRAIEEYLRNKNKFSCPSPTIKFLGNEGQLAFPSAGSTASFSFSMSSTQDMEGPGGSFECLRQLGPPKGHLENLGSIPYKIRVHANDDVYAATRQRMTVAEENHKNKCTREIKPNQTGIGRKVKVKQNVPAGGRSSVPQVPPSRAVVNEKPSQPYPSMRDSLLKPSSYPTQNAPSKQPSSSNHLAGNSMHHHLSNGLGSNHVSSTRPQNKPTTPDISKRPIKERLIHLLALKPFKKVELLDRLDKEGVREKGSISSVLKQVAFMKDNAYHLNRAFWHDVRENWPFYTESEKQILKRRKPQNLTPPGSSDSGSSGSGQSPTSTHPGSPPPPVTTSTKRPGYYDGVDGFPTKRQRVSHYRKPAEPAVNAPPAETKSQRRPITDSRDSSNMNPRSRESPSISTTTPSSNNVVSQTTPQNGHGNFTNGYAADEVVSSKKRLCDNYGSLSYDVRRDRVDRSPYANGYEVKRDAVEFQPSEKFSEDAPTVKEVPYQNGEAYPTERWATPENEVKRASPKYETSRYDRDVILSTANGIARVSPDSQSEPMLIPEPSPVENDLPIQIHDYVNEYTTIRNHDQRKRYKFDFVENYAEYKGLHGTVEKVSRMFADLEERLKKEKEGSPRHNEIQKEVWKLYRQYKKNLDFQKTKQRFQYLHGKLSHIKQLVKDFDAAVVKQQYQDDRY